MNRRKFVIFHLKYLNLFSNFKYSENENVLIFCGFFSTAIIKSVSTISIVVSSLCWIFLISSFLISATSSDSNAVPHTSSSFSLSSFDYFGSYWLCLLCSFRLCIFSYSTLTQKFKQYWNAKLTIKNRWSFVIGGKDLPGKDLAF